MPPVKAEHISFVFSQKTRLKLTKVRQVRSMQNM